MIVSMERSMEVDMRLGWVRVAAIVCVASSAVGIRVTQAQQAQQTQPAQQAPQAQTPDMPSEYKVVLQTLGRQGDFKANVLKVNIPRSDLSVTVAGVKTPTPFGFGGWVAMTKGDGGSEVMMGDLVLLEDEVNPVMSALLDNGIDVTALHNHFFWEQPRLFYMHVHGMGSAADLAKKVKPALDLIGKKGGASAGAAPTTAAQAKPPAAGASAPAAAATQINTQPTVFFLHYWGTGPADKLATGFRAALDELGKGKPSAHAGGAGH